MIQSQFNIKISYFNLTYRKQKKYLLRQIDIYKIYLLNK